MTVITVEERPRSDDYFGQCPECRKGGCLKFADHKWSWFMCPDCRTCWEFGYGICSEGLYMTEDEIAKDVESLTGCRIVKPIVDPKYLSDPTQEEIDEWEDVQAGRKQPTPRMKDLGPIAAANLSRESKAAN